MIGLLLVYKYNYLCMPNKPCSGRILASGSSSYFVSPMAPNKTASAFLQMLMVSSGNGLPVLSMS